MGLANNLDTALEKPLYHQDHITDDHASYGLESEDCDIIELNKTEGTVRPDS